MLYEVITRPDPARHVIVGDMKIHPDMEAFVRELKLELAKSQRREIFVLIHGYNTKFDSGIERTAQLSTDLEIDGAAVFYSWPSAGSLFGYKADRSQITPVITSYSIHYTKLYDIRMPFILSAK